jgi:hypothetical protein
VAAADLLVRLAPEFVGGMGCSITSTTRGQETWPLVKPLLPRACEMRRQIERDGWWN